MAAAKKQCFLKTHSLCTEIFIFHKFDDKNISFLNVLDIAPLN